MLEGFGTIISYDQRGWPEFTEEVYQNVRLIRHATSLGAMDLTMERRSAIPGQEYLPPSILRLCVDIEDVDDLWSDLNSAIPLAAP